MKTAASFVFLLPLLLLLTCNNGLDELLELQRIIIPITDGAQLNAASITALPDNSVVAIINDIEIQSTLVIDKNITITSWEKTATIRVTPGLRMFRVEPGGRLTLGDPRSKGTLILQGNNFAVSLIEVNASLTMNEGIILKGNGTSSSLYGGGVHISGSFTMNGGTISDNSATLGGGVHVTTGGIFFMNGGTISGNFAGNNGGGVDVASGGRFYFNGGEISGNIAANGGGVNTQGTSFMTNGTISDNEAGANGGGVSVQERAAVTDPSRFSMTGGRIYGNRTATLGSQLFVFGTTSPIEGIAIIFGTTYTGYTPIDNPIPY